jgi:hypothetical protein
MTEWELQVSLTRRWAAKGADVNGRPHMLVAWEVMAPSFGINDSRRFGEPAVDFLLVDEDGLLRAAEVKPSLPPSEARRAALQVTRLALLLHANFAVESLMRAHDACWSGAYGRLPTDRQPATMSDRFTAFFGRPLSWPRLLQPIERVIGAWSSSPSSPDVLAGLSAMGETELRELCAGTRRWDQRGQRLCRRLLDDLEAYGLPFREPIELLLLPREDGPESPSRQQTELG